jgi:hypothetical protein
MISRPRRLPPHKYVSLKSIVLELIATDFISRWDKYRMSFTFDDWLTLRPHDRCGRQRDQRRGHGESPPPFGCHSSYWGVGVDNDA